MFAQPEEDCIVVKPNFVQRVPVVRKGNMSYQVDGGVLLWVCAEPFSRPPESLSGYLRAKIKTWHVIDTYSWKPKGCE